MAVSEDDADIRLEVSASDGVLGGFSQVIGSTTASGVTNQSLNLTAKIDVFRARHDQPELTLHVSGVTPDAQELAVAPESLAIDALKASLEQKVVELNQFLSR